MNDGGKFIAMPLALWDREDLTPQAKLLFLALQRFVNAHGECWPSTATLMGAIGVKSRKTLYKYMNELIELRFVERHERHRARGGQTTNVYRLNMWGNKPTPATEITPEPQSKKDSPLPPETDTTPEEKEPTRPEYKIPTAPGEKIPTELYPDELYPDEDIRPAHDDNPPEPAASKLESLFEEFYEAYPRPGNREAALAAFRQAALKADPDDLISAARRYASSPDLPAVTWLPFPAKWLEESQFLPWLPPKRTASLAPTPEPSDSGDDPYLRPGTPEWDAIKGQLNRFRSTGSTKDRARVEAHQILGKTDPNADADRLKVS